MSPSYIYIYTYMHIVAVYFASSIVEDTDDTFVSSVQSGVKFFVNIFQENGFHNVSRDNQCLFCDRFY